MKEEDNGKGKGTDQGFTCNTPVGATFCSPGYLATEDPMIKKEGDGYVHPHTGQKIDVSQEHLNDLISEMLERLQLALDMFDEKQMDTCGFVIQSVLDDVDRRLDEIICVITRDVGEVYLDVAVGIQETDLLPAKKIRPGRVLRAYMEDAAG